MAQVSKYFSVKLVEKVSFAGKFLAVLEIVKTLVQEVKRWRKNLEHEGLMKNFSTFVNK